MTTPAPGGVGESAVVDGVDVDAVAAAVRQCDGVSGLDGGPYHEVATYLPGRTIDGVSVADGGRVQVQVRSRWGVEAPLLATLIQITLAPVGRLPSGRRDDLRHRRPARSGICGARPRPASARIAGPAPRLISSHVFSSVWM